MVSSEAIGVVVDCRMQRQRLRLVHVHLEPHQVERLDLLGDAAEAFGLVVEVEIDRDAELSGRRPARSAASCAMQRVEHLLRQVELGMARAARESPACTGGPPFLSNTRRFILTAL